MVKAVRLRGGKQPLSTKGLLLQLTGKPMHAGTQITPPTPTPYSPPTPPLTETGPLPDCKNSLKGGGEGAERVRKGGRHRRGL